MQSNDLADLAILLHPNDDVAIARAAIPAGTSLRIDGEGDDTLVTRTAIPSGHRIARRAVPQGAPVLRYGRRVGSTFWFALPLQARA
jgi:hypothetical protein